MNSQIESSEYSLQVMLRIHPPQSQHLIISDNQCQLQFRNKIYNFDHIFDANSSQIDVFKKVGTKIIDNTIKGYNSCIFAYGQTGTGKTYTMTGSNDNGLVQRILHGLYGILQKYMVFQVKISYLEIYNQNIADLLAEKSGKTVVLRQNIKLGFYAENLKEFTVNSVDELQYFITVGLKKRRTKETKMNVQSSRSHSILTISIMTRQVMSDMTYSIKTSKLNFVDLAGSQKQKDTGNTGERLKQASNINKSLTQLSLVISKLSEHKENQFIPYRNSVLTKLLKDSLGGNAMTYIITTVSSNQISFPETISTLQFAQKAKKIKVGIVKINEQIEGSTLQLKNRIKRLEIQITSLKIQLNKDCVQCQQYSKKIIQLQNLISDNNLIKNTKLFQSTLPQTPIKNEYNNNNNNNNNNIQQQIQQDNYPKYSIELLLHQNKIQQFQIENLTNQIEIKKSQQKYYQNILELFQKNLNKMKFNQTQKLILIAQNNKMKNCQKKLQQISYRRNQEKKLYQQALNRMNSAVISSNFKLSRLKSITMDQEQFETSFMKSKQKIDDLKKKIIRLEKQNKQQKILHQIEQNEHNNNIEKQKIDQLCLELDSMKESNLFLTEINQEISNKMKQNQQKYQEMQFKYNLIINEHIRLNQQNKELRRTNEGIQEVKMIKHYQYIQVKKNLEKLEKQNQELNKQINKMQNKIKEIQDRRYSYESSKIAQSRSLHWQLTQTQSLYCNQQTRQQKLKYNEKQKEQLRNNIIQLKEIEKMKDKEIRFISNQNKKLKNILQDGQKKQLLELQVKNEENLILRNQVKGLKDLFQNLKLSNTKNSTKITDINEEVRDQIKSYIKDSKLNTEKLIQISKKKEELFISSLQEIYKIAGLQYQANTTNINQLKTFIESAMKVKKQNENLQYKRKSLQKNGIILQ